MKVYIAENLQDLIWSQLFLSSFLRLKKFTLSRYCYWVLSVKLGRCHGKAPILISSSDSQALWLLCSQRKYQKDQHEPLHNIQSLEPTWHSRNSLNSYTPPVHLSQATRECLMMSPRKGQVPMYLGKRKSTHDQAFNLKFIITLKCT